MVKSKKWYLTVFMVLCILLCLCGCSPSETNKHNHNFSAEEVVSPTCTKEGYTKFTCTACGFKVWGDYVPALQNGGHVYVDCVCIECSDFLINEAADTVALKYTKATDENGNNIYEVTGVTADSEYIKIPSTYNGVPVTKIADEAFGNLLDLKHVIIPESIVSVGNAAFKDCFNLISVTILGNELSMDNDVFWNCYNLKSISFSSIREINDYAFVGCESIENVILSDDITVIGIHTFGDCYKLKSITIPISVKEILHGAFWNCYNLKDIFYKGTIEQWHTINKEKGAYTNTNKDASWDAYTGNYTVHCIDGDITKNQTNL